MIAYKPALGAPRPRLGQAAVFFSGGLADALAKKVVEEGEKGVRRVVRDERNRLAEAFLRSIPFLALSSVSYVVTSYIVPSRPIPKTVGYGLSGLLAAVGTWLGAARLAEPVRKPPAPSGPSPLDPIVNSAARAIVAAAEPPIRRIVEEERARIAAAAQAGLPFVVAGIASFIVTMLAVDPKDTTLKAVGYSGSIALLGAAAWTTLEKEKTLSS